MAYDSYAINTLCNKRKIWLISHINYLYEYIENRQKKTVDIFTKRGCIKCPLNYKCRLNSASSDECINYINKNIF